MGNLVWDLLGGLFGASVWVPSKAMSPNVLRKFSAAGFRNIFHFKVKL